VSGPRRAEAFQLSDGREMIVRPIQPEDAAPIAASFQLLNEDEVRRRFLHILKSLGEEHLRQLTHPAEDSEFVVVAAEPLPAGEALVAAVARLARDTNDPARAEFGILVSHFVMDFCCQLCRKPFLSDKLRCMDDNTPMLELASHLGFQRTSTHGSPGLVRITLQLAPTRH